MIRKIPIRSPGLIFVQKTFFLGLGTGQKVQGGGGGGRSMGESEGPKTHDPPPFMGIKSADPPPGSG